MAGRGPAPSAERSRKRDTEARQAETTTVPRATGRVRGPALPKGIDWHPQTQALWRALRTSPLLVDEPALGWQFLIDTALMHHTMWTMGRWEFASEVRLRLAKFGATPEDRQRLRIKVERPGVKRGGTSGPAAPSTVAARRAGLHIAG